MIKMLIINLKYLQHFNDVKMTKLNCELTCNKNYTLALE